MIIDGFIYTYNLIGDKNNKIISTIEEQTPEKYSFSIQNGGNVNTQAQQDKQSVPTCWSVKSEDGVGTHVLPGKKEGALSIPLSGELAEEEDFFSNFGDDPFNDFDNETFKWK